MKHLFLILSFVSAASVKAQAPDYDDLLILYADGNYEKLIRASEKYISSDKTKADAAPYLFITKGLYKISFVPDRDEKYKNAFKDGINYMGMFLKKDKSKSVQNDVDNKKFINEFKSYFVETILNDVASNDYRKAAGWLPKYYKLMPNFAGAKFLEGVCKIKNGDKSSGNALIKEGEKLLLAITDFEALGDGDKLLLMHGMMQVADSYVATKQAEKAKTLMGKGAQWFEGNEDWKLKYDEIVN
jgi:hypothetical protein